MRLFEITNHLAHSPSPLKNEMFAQKISYTFPKKRFSNEGIFLHPPERTDFFHKEKISQAYPKNTNFRNENNFFNYRKNDFLNKTFLIRD